MKTNFIAILLLLLTLSNCTNSQTPSEVNLPSKDSILKLEMNLSAFGVEADDFPSITVFIDFTKDSSSCSTSYYNPAYKGRDYMLTKEEIKRVFDLLNKTDLTKLKTKYTCNKSDQPSSTTTIYTSNQKYNINDYGLLADEPLKEIYKIVYKY